MYGVWCMYGVCMPCTYVCEDARWSVLLYVCILSDVKDSYSSQRPLLAVVPKPYDTLVPFSLQEGKELGKKYHISFKTGKTKAGEIVNIVSNARFVMCLSSFDFGKA